MSLSQSLSLSFSWKEKQRRKPQAVWELDRRKQVLQPIRFLLHLCVTIVWQVCAWSSPSLCVWPPVRLSWTPLQSLYIWVLFQKLVRCLQSQHRKAFSWLFYIKGNLIMTPSVPLDSKTYQCTAMSFQLSKKYSKKVNKRNIYNIQTWISFNIFIDHIL